MSDASAESARGPASALRKRLPLLGVIALDEAKARVQTAAAALEETRVGARAEQIAAARARLVAAQVAVDKAQIDVDRARALFASQSIAQAQLDEAETALKGANAQRDAASQALDELKNGSRREDIAQASARALEARANAKLVQAGTRVEDMHAAEAVVKASEGRLQQIDVGIAELVIRAPRAARVLGERVDADRHLSSRSIFAPAICWRRAPPPPPWSKTTSCAPRGGADAALEERGRAGRDQRGDGRHQRAQLQAAHALTTRRK